jgi:hypothetical protein
MFIDYIKPRSKKLLGRLFLLELFTFLPDRKCRDDNVKQEDGIILFSKQGMTIDNAEYGYYENGKFIDIPKSKYGNGVPFSIHDIILLSDGDILNYTGKQQIKTTIGRYLINYFLIVDPIKDLIPYVNGLWNIEGIENQYAKLLLNGDIKTKNYRKYLDNGYFISHFGELCIPTISERSLSTDPKVKVRLKELLEQYKDKLDDPKIISSIEKELIDMDKAWIKGDSSEGFFGATAGKSYNVHRKKMFIMVGGVESFSKEGGIELIKSSLSDGITPESFAAVANESRRGSYGRGIETAKGGEITKFISRAFQDVKIIEDDCKTNVGIDIIFTKYIDPLEFVGRTVIDGNKQIEINKENIKQFENKKVIIRSPMCCKTKGGMCYKCCGNNFKRLNITKPGIQAINISSKFMGSAMKSMHGTTIRTEFIDPFNFFNNK